MIFQSPLMLLLLAALPILGKILLRAHRKRIEAAARLRGQKKASNGWKKNVSLQLSAFASLIIALAQPAWNPHPGPSQAQGRDLAIALDISRSMLAADVFPTRLDAAKIALTESLELLQGQKIGLITFAGAASVRVPLTLDHNFVRYMLDRAQPSDANVGSTSLQAAIEKAIDVVLTESEEGNQDILIMTDGEDHISNIETTVKELRECGARVLIIGLGDPVTGAKIPHLTETNAWMQYKGEDVISRLDEEKLLQLSADSPNVIYYPARTRPFDVITLYRQMIQNTAGLPIRDETRMVYTEGYPLFIALGLLLWLIPLGRQLFPALAALLISAGCSQEIPTASPLLQTGQTLWADAQPDLETNPETALLKLTEARRIFLQAALQQPGDMAAARQIAGISRQIRTVEQAIQEKEEAEKDLQQRLQEVIEQLQLLVQRENQLAENSRQLLRKRPPASEEEQAAAAEPARSEQAEVGTATDAVLETVTDVQSLIRKMLSAAFSSGETPLPTEFDEPVSKLTQARQQQTESVENLNPDQLLWPQANSAFHSAAGLMQDALTALSGQNRQQGSDEDSGMSEESETEWEFNENMAWEESDGPSDLSVPMASDSFKTALGNRSLPVPNYTAEEILMEETANMEQRAQQQSSRAGANVEKNW